jgi:hypothetical protein
MKHIANSVMCNFEFQHLWLTFRPGDDKGRSELYCRFMLYHYLETDPDDFKWEICDN